MGDSETVTMTSGFDKSEKHDPGEGNGSLSFCDLFRIRCVAGDQTIAFVRVKSASLFGVVQGQASFALQRGELLSPVGNGFIVAHPNFVRFRIELVAKTQGQNFVAAIQKVVSTFICLWVCPECIRKVRKLVSATDFMARHVVKMA